MVESLLFDGVCLHVINDTDMVVADLQGANIKEVKNDNRIW